MEEAPYEMASLRSFSRLSLTQIRRLQFRQNICRDSIQHGFAFTDDPQYSRSITVPLRRPSCDTIKIAGAAVLGLDAIYKPEYLYAKAGVMLLDRQPDSLVQNELDQDDDSKDAGKLMTAMYVLNRRYGKGTVIVGSSGTAGAKRAWSMKQERRTPAYTTCWEDMPRVRA